MQSIYKELPKFNALIKHINYAYKNKIYTPNFRIM